MPAPPMIQHDCTDHPTGPAVYLCVCALTCGDDCVAVYLDPDHPEAPPLFLCAGCVQEQQTAFVAKCRQCVAAAWEKAHPGESFEAEVAKLIARFKETTPDEHSKI